jgi:putative ABC transport system permease protein
MTIEMWIHDVRLAWRGLLRARAFTIAAVLTLALGMTGATSMFAVIQGVLLRTLPMPESERLVAVWKWLPAAGGARVPIRAAEVDLIGDANRLFAKVAAVGYNDPTPSEIIDGTSATYINTVRVSGDFFDVLGVPPFLGRALTRVDDTSGSEPVLVLTYRLWQRRYGGARDVIGRRLTLGDQRFTIVGVMPPDVEYPRGVEAWMSVEGRAIATRNPIFQGAARNELEVLARLQPGVTIAQAASGLVAMVPELDATVPPGAPAVGAVPVVRSIADVVVGDVRAGMLVLFGAVGLVLLIASANVANLLLVRGEIRRPELALRIALGASRRRLMGQITAESLLLTVMAGAIGLAVTWGSLRALIALAPGGLPRVDSIRIDGGVVIFVAGLALVTTVLAGLVPALAAGRLSLAVDLQRGGRLAGRGTRRGRRALVVAQVALAVTVVTATGLVARSLLRLQAAGTEVGADHLVLASLVLPQDAYAERDRHLQLLNELVARIEAAPTIAAVTPINAVPFSGVGWDVPTFTAEGQSATQAAANGSLNLEAIQPGYFETFAAPLVRGRPFEDNYREDAPAVAIVSEDVAARVWPGEDPIGKRLKMGDIDSVDVWRTVVGVAARTRYRDLRASQPTLYVPAAQLIVTAQSLVVRSTAPLSLVAGVVRDQVRAIDPGIRVSRVAPFSELLREPLARPRFYAILLAMFGGSALLLAAIGLYAVIAAAVRQRYAEIGVRLALGASPADVRRLIVREGFQLAAIGAGAGLALAAMVAQLMHGLLYEVHPRDPMTLAVATLLLLAAAIVASYIPARTASRLDPLVALRTD